MIQYVRVWIFKKNYEIALLIEIVTMALFVEKNRYRKVARV